MARKEPTASGNSADGGEADELEIASAKTHDSGESETLSDGTARIVRQRVVVAPNNKDHDAQRIALEPPRVAKLSPDEATLAAPPRAVPSSDEDAPENAPLPTFERSRYRDLGEHARGGMGRVLLAWDHRLGRTVAIKELLSKTAGAAPRFVREAVLTARLQHPSIVPVHEAGRWPSGEPFYAMKLVSGQPLMRLIEDKQSLDERLALLPIVIAVCEAVAYAHSQRVIHRDLKPDNIIVGKYGETVVIDWGLAKKLDTPDDPEPPSSSPSSSAPSSSSSPSSNRGSSSSPLPSSSASSLASTLLPSPSPPASPTPPRVSPAAPPPALQTSYGAIIGTPGYMAPEQARGEPLDERADVFALGAILFATLAGRAPFTGTTAREVVTKTASDAPSSLRERVPDAPDDLVAIVERATARDREQRYPTAEALAADLKRFTTGQLVKARRYTRSELLIRWLRRHRVPLSIAGSALLLLLVVGVLSVARIVREKRRADVERASAVAAQAREAARVDQLILAQATESLDHDPTAAMAWLKRLRPASPLWREARAVASEAQFRGVALAQLEGHHGPIAALAFASDGARLFSAGEDGALLRWQLATRVAEEIDRGVKRSDLALSSDGTRLVAGGADGSLVVVDAAGKRAHPAPRRGLWLGEIALSADGRVAAAVTSDGIRVFDLDGGGERSIEAREPVSVTLSRDGGRLAFADRDGVHVLDTPINAEPAADVDSSTSTKVDPATAAHTPNPNAADPHAVAAPIDPQTAAHTDSRTGNSLVESRTPNASADSRAPSRLADSHAAHSRVDSPANNSLGDFRAANASADSRATNASADSRAANASADSRAPNASADSRAPNASADSRAVNASADSRAPSHLAGSRAAHSRVDSRANNSPPDSRAENARDLRGAPTHAAPAINVVNGKFDGARIVRLTPDGRWLAAGGKREARLWDLAAAAPPLAIALDATATRLDFSPDGARIALGLDDGAVRLWEPAAARNSELAHHGEVAVLDVRFAPDGKRLAAARGSIVRVWDLDSNVQRKLRGPPADVLRLAWSGDSALLATGAADGDIRVWRVTDGDSPLRRVAAALPEAMTALSGDGRWLARVADKNVIILHDVTTGAERSLPAPPPNALVIGGHWLCAVFGDDAWCWAVENPVQKSVRAPAAVSDFAIAADGKTMAMATDGGVMLIDTGGGKPRRWSAPSPVIRVALSPDGKRAAVAGEDGEVLLLDGTTTARRLGHAGAVAALGFSGDGAFVVARGRDERSIVTFALGDSTSSNPSSAPRMSSPPPSTGAATARYLEEDPITAWSFVEGDHILLTGSATGAVRARDLDGGRQWTLSGHRGRILAVAARVSALLWSAGEDGTVRSWPIPAPSPPRLRPFLDEETSVTIDDDSRLH